jgi:hypothetical protein
LSDANCTAQGADLTGSATVTVSAQPVLKVVGYSNRTPVLMLDGTAGSRYALQGSTDLLQWMNLATNVAPYALPDPSATNLPYRFYRAFCVP